MQNSKNISHYLALLILILMCGPIGCMKTRAQLRSDDANESDAAAARTAPAPVPAAISSTTADEMKYEITQLTGRIETLEQQLKQKESAEGDPAEKIAKLQERIAALESQQAQLQETIDAQKPMTTADGHSKTPDQLFKKGKEQFESEKYEAAIGTFTQYLAHPQIHEKSPKAAEATFYKGESYYQLKNYNKAILEYSKFPEGKFSKNTLLPQALYKIALAFDAKGMKDDANAFYQELVDHHVKTEEGRIAQRILNDRLPSGNKGTKVSKKKRGGDRD